MDETKLNSLKIDGCESEKIASTSEKSTSPDSPKFGFWQNLINMRESLSKGVNEKISISSRRESETTKASPRSSQLSTRSGHSKKVGVDDEDGDCISDLIGHTGVWQFTWSFVLILFQVPSAFHIFSFVFQVSHVSYSFLWYSTTISSTESMCQVKFRFKIDRQPEFGSMAAHTQMYRLNFFLFN